MVFRNFQHYSNVCVRWDFLPIACVIGLQTRSGQVCQDLCVSARWQEKVEAASIVTMLSKELQKLSSLTQNVLNVSTFCLLFIGVTDIIMDASK